MSKSLQDIEARLLNADLPGVEVEVTAEEAELLGAFEEDALSAIDAYQSAFDPAEDVEVDHE